MNARGLIDASRTPQLLARLQLIARHRGARNLSDRLLCARLSDRSGPLRPRRRCLTVTEADAIERMFATLPDSVRAELNPADDADKNEPV